ncbi:MAG: hypothetical protein AAFY11_04415 [Cyanobacteria bacterium J06641_5]
MEELRSALALATEEELRDITRILFCRKLNPLDYFSMPEPAEIQSKTREAQLDAIEARFRFLAADGLTVLRQRTQEITYHQVLCRVCKHLKLSVVTDRLSALDLETEVFLHLVNRAWKTLPKAKQASMLAQMGQSMAALTPPEPLPARFRDNPLELLLRSSGTIAVSALLRSWLLQQFTRQLALQAVQLAQYQIARQALIKGGAAAATQLQKQLAVHSARQSLAFASVRVGAMRVAVSCLGPLLWSWLLADLSWKAIATNYSRVIPCVFAIAQIRLTRGEDWAPIAYA